MADGPDAVCAACSAESPWAGELADFLGRVDAELRTNSMEKKPWAAERAILWPNGQLGVVRPMLMLTELYWHVGKLQAALAAGASADEQAGLAADIAASAFIYSEAVHVGV